MARANNIVPSQGRTPFEIDWKLVDNLLMAGSSGVQIASVLGVHPDTLYDRCVKDKKKGWTLYSYEKREKGNSALLSKQFDVAVKGNVSMLIWLGKQRLDQKENLKEVNPNEEKISTENKVIRENNELRKEIELLKKEANESKPQAN